MADPGKLYIVATPIGNPKDITLRALETLQKVDVIICEEHRRGTTLLKKLNIDYKNLITLNEHNEDEQISIVIDTLLVQNLDMALISDCGTPVFADPGFHLLQSLISYNVQIVPIPGPSSLMTALSILNINIDQFIFGGFLPRDSRLRTTEIKRLRKINIPIILMDTPYRLNALLEDVQKSIGKCQITLACDLTTKKEKILRGNIAEIRKQIGKQKCEFILIIH